MRFQRPSSRCAESRWCGSYEQKLLGRPRGGTLLARRRLPRVIGGDNKLQPFLRDGSEKAVRPFFVLPGGVASGALHASAPGQIFCIALNLMFAEDDRHTRLCYCSAALPPAAMMEAPTGAILIHLVQLRQGN